MVYRLVYVSSSSTMMEDEELDAILDVSRKNNSALNITGMLLYHDGTFFQVLEGPKENVEARYDVIKKDSRHHGCTMLMSEDSLERNYAEWKMGYVPFSSLSKEQKDGFFNLLKLRDPGAVEAMGEDTTVSILTRTYLSSLGSEFIR